MKKLIALMLVVFTMILVIGAASAETLGFGFVNAEDVALRRGIGGKMLIRIPKDSCVWIRDSRKDSSGKLWYEVNYGVHKDYRNNDFTGWMMAEFIDAGNDVWHDIVEISSSKGLIARRADGSVVTAYHDILSYDGLGWQQPRYAMNQTEKIIQVTDSEGSSELYAVTESGTLIAAGSARQTTVPGGLRMISTGDAPVGLTRNQQLVGIFSRMDFTPWRPENGINSSILSQVKQMRYWNGLLYLLTEQGNLYILKGGDIPADITVPDYSGWENGIESFATTNMLNKSQMKIIQLSAAVLQNGNVLAQPDFLQEKVGGWTKMKDIKINGDWVLGLRQDGTVCSAGLGGHQAVSGTESWTGITAIAQGNDFCVGLKEDGTLVFAGDHLFFREGHVRN